ncbi:palmitoyltransferase ZDHHC2/15/20 [Nematocida parisii]|uniref:Palmitoyltransferase n=1 Tax=Nematocida parisii (strain ERTm3) TaxID=935791 RepID=I3EH12_NEMP3|nr:uncharacterized protein NEPG_00283 [Nematocida parisii ERTm1]EIJ88509.1 hypothetical protein NEQG_01199 [Nematocida parisii ERTm3]KAI5127777.1 palmitoyltransferase ZDHHC2/15/20 [Nematocida parisii]EIJ94759.1 hypothetical protein NEPG_00283 [Nematocida parisii ERTm1]KAI5128244.1 palmitoyltransferase ZDHHC2/15/20 [Nematocida parisii]KAI5142412.1 palmitoyltransferase ZDHHC2/15/20 [Nematocida parisii]|eukprot:XP_013058115.1 hypothetical protein NEPG_00283 [Nematocida parisii ERTm1]
MFEYKNAVQTIWYAIQRVLVIFSGIYIFFAYNTIYALQMLKEVSITVLCIFVVYQALVLLVGFSFLRMSISKNCTTHELFPEAVERDGDSDDSSLCINPFEKEYMFAYKHEMNTCEKCNTSQPLRSYHCDKCHQCLLLMYKHLTWCDLCIGFTNYKFYVVFLFYLMLMNLISFGCFIHSLLISLSEKKEIAAITVALSLQVVVIIFTAYFLGECIYSICINQTPQERKHPVENTNISYDMGYYQNWKIIMGESWYMWFIPSWTTQGDGLKFQHTRKVEPEVYEDTLPTSPL